MKVADIQLATILQAFRDGAAGTGIVYEIMPPRSIVINGALHHGAVMMQPRADLAGRV